ncbi:MAG: hypothetical protein M1814_002786 [Vezdaea aestivalis]|nr:MAG: hypothetical protein M1814_002786 [Vezdaea aestivalis]
MRDLHHNSHITTSGHDSLRLEKEAADDNYSLFMDLVKADKVDHAKDLINQFTLFEFKFSGAARHLFSFGSVAMVDLVISRLGWLTESRYEPKENPIKWSLKAGKNDVVAHLFSISSASSDPWISHCYLSCLPTLLEIESEELFEKWLSTLLRVEQFDKSEHKSQSKRIEEIWRYITDARTVKATRRQIGGEDMLISSWRKVYDGTKIAQNALGRALRHVAQTTCSIRLAMYLINRGVKVDHTWSKVSLTPLCAAAQRSSFANAEMMEYLLNQGADPEYQSEKILPYRGTGLGTRGHNKVQIKDQIGAKEIAKWLGRSWDEVVENARRSREERKAETEAASRGQEVL